MRLALNIADSPGRYSQQNFEVLGMASLLSTNLTKVPFQIVSTTLYTKLLQSLPALKKFLITSSASYVPDMLRLYMQKAYDDKRAFIASDLSTIWLPFFESRGFDRDITTLFFAFFIKMNQDGLVPREIWFPSSDPRGAPKEAGGGNVVISASSGNKWMMPLIIGAGAIGTGFIFFLAMKK